MKNGADVSFDPFWPYVPRWLRARAPLLPGYEERAAATVLYADLAGFTTLAEILAPLTDGAERLDAVLAALFSPLVAAIHAQDGDVIRFAGDSIAAVFASVRAAVLAAQAMQERIPSSVETPRGSFPLGLRVGVASGELRWRIVGTVEHGLYWVVYGPALEAAIAAEERAQSGEVVGRLDVASPVQLLGGKRSTAQQEMAAPRRSSDALRPYLPSTLVERLLSGLGAFVSEYRRLCPAFVALPAGRDLQEMLATVLPLVSEFGGRLNEVEVGDKGRLLVLLFGAPLAHEDDPILAAGCLRALQKAGVLARAGLTLGTLFVGQVGTPARHTYTAVGAEMNLACALMQAASPGEILVSRRVQKAIGGRFAFRERGAVRVKGRDLPVPVAALQEAQVAPAPWPVSGVSLQGRQEELRQARAAIARVNADQVVALRIVGEAGIGKTRLAQEIAYLAEGEGMVVLSGSARADRRGVAYYAWREPLRSLLETSVGPAGDPFVALSALKPDWQERAPLLGDLLGRPVPDTPTTVAFDARMRHESTRSLAADLLRWKAQAGPLCLLLDDLHWADDLSLDLVHALARRAQGVPLLLLLVHRPFGEPLPDVLLGLPEHTILELSELDEPAAAALVRSRAGDLPEPIVAQIVSRGGGHPLFLEALVSIYRETGSLDVPETVQGVVQAHIDRLAEPERMTLKVASVLGRSFLYDDFPPIHPLLPDESVLREHLDRLTHSDLTLLECIEPLTYAFKHIIVQEVAYASLLYAQRQSLHEAAGRWYRQCRPDDFPLLAYHWGRSNLEDPSNREQARCYYRWAGEQLAARFANAEAVTCLSRALELAPETATAERYAILLARETVYSLQGERQAQRQDLEALRGLAQILDEEALSESTVGGFRAEIALRQARYAELVGDYLQAAASVEEAVALSKQEVGLEAIRHRAAGHLRWGQVLWEQGDYEGARAQLGQALSLARQGQLGQVEADIRRSMGVVSYYRGDYAEARAHYEQSLSIFQEMGQRQGEGAVLNNLGLVCWSLGDYAGAVAYYERGLGIVREIGDRHNESKILGNLGAVMDFLGDYVSSREHFEQALAITYEIGDRRGVALTLNSLGFVFQRLGDYGRADAYYRRALGEFHEMGHRQGEGLVLSNLCLLAHHLGDDEAAHEYGRQARGILQEIGARRLEAYALSRLGHALAGLGSLAEAAASYRRALEIRRELGQQTLAVEALAGLARVALAQKQSAQAQVEEILAHLENNTFDGADEPLRIYLTCYRALRADGDPRAEDVLRTGYDLLQEQAAKIADEELRGMFLGNVAAHREILDQFGAGAHAPAEHPEG